MPSYALRGVHGQTVDLLGRRIARGEPAEDGVLDLAALREELGVSLTALREALKVLAAKGLVDARQRRGTYVLPRARWDLLDADVLRWCLAAGDTAGPGAGALDAALAELRQVVEPGAARLAAARRAPAGLAALGAALAGPAVDDAAFHRALLAAAGNEVLARLEGALGTGLADRACAGVPADHRALLDAVRSGDPDAAEAAARALRAPRP